MLITTTGADRNAHTLSQDIVPGWYCCYGETEPSLHVTEVHLYPAARTVRLVYTRTMVGTGRVHQRTTDTPWDNPWYMVLDVYIINELVLT